MMNRLTITNILIYLLILNKVYCMICNFNVRINQTLQNEGFHRNLSYYIDFASDDEAEKLMYDGCTIALDQVLPPGVFTTHDEIKDHKCKDLIHTKVKTPVNVEQPAEDASPITIQLFGRVDREDSRIHIYIPVHARYHHAARGGRMVRNIIPPPVLNILCPHRRLDMCDFPADSYATSFCTKDSTNDYCPWKELPAKMVSDTVFWDVPIGNTDHYYLVAWGTTIVIVVGSLYLLKTIHGYKMDSERRKKKLNT